MKSILFKSLLSFSAVAVLSSSSTAGSFLVSSYFSSTVQRYSTSGQYLGGATGYSFSGPQAIIRGKDGLLYIADEGHNAIVRLNSDSLAYHSTFLSGVGLSGPTGIAFDSTGNLLVASFNTNSVRRYQGGTGQFLGEVFVPGLGGLNGPDVGLTIGPDGALYVPSFYSHKILRYDPTTGAFLSVFADSASGLTQPRTMLWRDGKMYVTSDNGSKVLRYDAATGLFLGNFVAPGAGGLWGASGMTFDENGNMLLTSWRNDRILRFNGNTGAFMENVVLGGNGNLDGPTFLTTVPEPSSFVVLGLAAIIGLRAHRKR